MLREIFPKNMYTKYENVVKNITEMSFRIFSSTIFMVQVHHNIHSIKKKTCRKKKLNFSRSALFHMNTRFCLKYFVLDCHCKLVFFGSGLPQAPLNLICLTILGTLRLLTLF